MTNVSIIICTYNRGDSLGDTLQSICNLHVPQELDLEVLIVDNNSRDNTKQIVERFHDEGNARLRYIFEPRQGLSFARNAGIEAAKGEFILFTDDDVIVDPNWLSELADAFLQHGADCAGGKILPVWPGERPSWLSARNEYALAILDYGDDLRELKIEDPPLFGANIAFSRRILQLVGSFNTSLGRMGGKLYCSEDTEIYARILQSNAKIIYQPRAIVHHVISANRLQKKYFRKWHFDGGIGQGISLGRYEKRNILGIPYYIIREFLEHGLKYMLALPTMKNDAIFFQEMKLLYYSGIMYSRVKIHFNGTFQ